MIQEWCKTKKKLECWQLPAAAAIALLCTALPDCITLSAAQVIDYVQQNASLYDLTKAVSKSWLVWTATVHPVSYRIAVQCVSHKRHPSHAGIGFFASYGTIVESPLSHSLVNIYVSGHGSAIFLQDLTAIFPVFFSFSFFHDDRSEVGSGKLKLHRSVRTCVHHVVEKETRRTLSEGLNWECCPINIFTLLRASHINIALGPERSTSWLSGNCHPACHSFCG